MVEKLDYLEFKKGVRNLRLLTTLIPRRYVTATCFILRQLALYNSQLLLFPILIKAILDLLKSLKPKETSNYTKIFK